MKTLQDVKKLAVLVNELPKQEFGTELKNAYLVMLATKKPFFVNYALFSDLVDGVENYTAYAEVAYERNPNLHNIEFGTDDRDYLPHNVISGFRGIEALLNGKIVGSLSSAFLNQSQAEVV